MVQQHNDKAVTNGKLMIFSFLVGAFKFIEKDLTDRQS